MNSKIGYMGIAAAALGGVLLAGCDSVRDVREEPFTAVPTPMGVLEGTITGLGNARPVVLSYDGQDDCRAPDPADASLQVPAPCKFFGTAGINESHFSFGSLPNGTAYNITVQKQPYGKICTVSNGSGTIGSSTNGIAIGCVNDPAVPRYDLTVSLAAALQTLPNLSVKVETEEAVITKSATGLTSVVFPGVLINTATNLPAFRFQVTTTTDTTVGGATTTNYCSFTPNATQFTQGGTNVSSAGVTYVPTAAMTVTANACQFSVTANVQYNAAPGQTAQAMPTGGLKLALKNHFTGAVEQEVTVAAFSPTTAASVTFPTALLANATSVRELVVSQQPTGMQCVVAGLEQVLADTQAAAAGAVAVINAPTASAVMLVDPRNPNWWAYANRQVRCRATPTGGAVLRGTYQMDARDGTQPNTDPARPYGRARDFITFFEDGTFLFGINANSASYTANHPNTTFATSGASVRGNWAASSGVVHGFYFYNNVANTIDFTVFTATNINTASRGINGMPGYASVNTNVAGVAVLSTGSVKASNVVKASSAGLGTLSMEFGTGTGLRRWTMTEPESIAGELTGTWVSADHRRMFTYNKGTTYTFHMGVNGLGNVQDVCMLPTDASTQVSGVITKHAGSATDDNFIYTCTPGIWNLGAAFVFARTVDLPHYTASNGPVSGLGIGPTTPQAIPGVAMRFPGMQSQLDNRPTSPVNFEVVAGAGGAPDTLHVQNTLNGTPIDLPLTFIRERAN